MNSIQEGRSARIDLRVPGETKALVERAADLEGKSLTAFVEAVVVERAKSVLEHYETTRHTRRDQEAFLALLDSEEGPSEALTQAIDRYLAVGNEPIILPKSK